MTATRPNLRSTAPAKRSDDWFMGTIPSARLALFRVLVGLYSTIYLAARIPHLVDVSDLPQLSFRPVTGTWIARSRCSTARSRSR